MSHIDPVFLSFILRCGVNGAHPPDVLLPLWWRNMILHIVTQVLSCSFRKNTFFTFSHLLRSENLLPLCLYQNISNTSQT